MKWKIIGEVVDMQIERNKKIFKDAGFEPDNLLVCFNGYQLSKMLKKIFASKESPDKVLEDNKNLYRVGYYNENSNLILKVCLKY